MNLIRMRLNFMVFCILGAMIWCGMQTMRAYEAWYTDQQRLNANLELQSLLLQVREGDGTVDDRLQLKRQRAAAAFPKLNERLSDVIQADAEGNKQLLKLRCDAALEIAKIENRTLSNHLASLKEPLENNALICFVLPIFGFIFIIFYLRKKIFYSVQRLSRRMHDFLVDRYSFQFSTPEQNEMGDLQRTFNALAQRVINSMDELKSLDQAKSEFLSIASHELRTPMTSIKGSLTLLNTGVVGNLDLNSLRLLKIAESETDRLIRLINELLDLAKIEASELSLKRDWIEWNKLAEKTCAGLAGLSHSSGVALQIEAGENLEIYADGDRLQQVLTNLISNAIKFSPAGAAVTLRAFADAKRHLRIEVSDQGRGIAPADQEVIFQKFRQAANSDNPLIKGTGLGLAIAKALVAEHGGTIGVQSTVGQGSTFYFTLPEWRQAPVQISAVAA
jgi:signal transduction histidine kinase